MGVKSQLRMSKRVLTNQGLFLKETGDIMKVVYFLQRKKIQVEVLDTEFAVLFEEAQKRRVIYEPYRDAIYAGRAVCRLMKNETLQQAKEFSYEKALKQSSFWKIRLRMSISKIILNELQKTYGVEEGLKRYKTVSKQLSHDARNIQGRYEFAYGIFFESEEDLTQAFTLLNETYPLLRGSVMPSEVALAGFYLDEMMRDRPVGTVNLLKLAQEVTRQSKSWRLDLRREMKRAMLEEVHVVYKANKTYYKEFWAIDFMSENEDYEVLSEDKLDLYSPSLRPDLYQTPKPSLKQSHQRYEVIELREVKAPIRTVQKTSKPFMTWNLQRT